jgi:hypothetical protein
MRLSMLREHVGADTSGFVVLGRWLLKPLEPLVMETQEPKVNIMPSSSTALVKLNNAIKFAW